MLVGHPVDDEKEVVLLEWPTLRALARFDGARAIAALAGASIAWSVSSDEGDFVHVGEPARPPLSFRRFDLKTTGSSFALSPSGEWLAIQRRISRTRPHAYEIDVSSLRSEERRTYRGIGGVRRGLAVSNAGVPLAIGSMGADPWSTAIDHFIVGDRLVSMTEVGISADDEIAIDSAASRLAVRGQGQIAVFHVEDGTRLVKVDVETLAPSLPLLVTDRFLVAFTGPANGPGVVRAWRYGAEVSEWSWRSEPDWLPKDWPLVSAEGILLWNTDCGPGREFAWFDLEAI